MKALAIARVLLLLLATFGLGSAAHAQVTTRYTNTTDSATNGISDTATPCTAPFTRTFVVGTSYTVADVNIGVMMSHTYRGDLRISLVAPDGTRIQLIDAIGGTRNNLNVLFDDAAVNSIATHTGSNDSAGATTAVPPYQRTFAPASSLAGFNGKSSLGTWTLEICDQFSGDTGTFHQADLYLTSPPPAFADLSLAKTIVGAAPASGGNVTWRLTVTNSAASTAAASAVAVTDYLPSGFTFISASGTGTFDSATGVWSVGSVPIGASRSIDITGSISASAGASITNAAEITASSQSDNDSTVNNGVTTEDDYDTDTFIVAGSRIAGTPPVLTCPAGTVSHIWDPATWTAGTTSSSYALGSLGNIGFTLTNPGLWLNNATLGGQSPNVQTAMNGGFVGEAALMELVDLPSLSARATTSISLPKVMQGAQFRLYDVDYAAAQFADFVSIEGRYQGATVIPTVTNGISNYVIANAAFGDGASATGAADGNVVVTFSSPIDTIIISYGNHSLAPTDPGQQGIAVGNITFCHPTTTVTVAKSSVVLRDPVNAAVNPKAITGATVQYCIVVSNTGTVDSTSVIAFDNLPISVMYSPTTLKSGSTCAAAATSEDDDNTGPDESDPLGASYAGGSVILVAPSLAAAQSVAVTFEAVVN